jgi:SPP1 family predicted phage head-tail adaptor
MVVAAGKLGHRIELHSASETSDDYGDVLESWSSYATVWARVMPLQGRELLLAQQVNAELTHQVEIRYNSTVTTTHRVILGSRTLEIVSIINEDERNKNMIMLCKELV